MEVLRAAVLVPLPAIREVRQVPMFWPNRMYMAVERGIRPCPARACRRPTLAAEEFSTMQMTAPINTPRIGLEMLWIAVLKPSHSRMGTMASLMPFMPMNRRPMPMTIGPNSRTMRNCFFFFGKLDRTSPKKANSMPKLTPSRESSRGVTVVPMLAPMITPMAWIRLSISALTKPTTMTVVAVEDWTSTVIRIPHSMDRKRLRVMA